MTGWSVDLALDLALPGRAVRSVTLSLAGRLRVEYTIDPGRDAPRLYVEFEDDAGTLYSPVLGGVEPGPVARGDDEADPPPPEATVLAVHLAGDRAGTSVVTRWVDLADPGRVTPRVTAWRAERARRLDAVVATVAAYGPMSRDALAARLALLPGHAHPWVRHLLGTGALTGDGDLSATRPGGAA